MKNNIILSVLLVALLTATYFLQEKKTEADFEKSLTEGRLLQTEITKLTLPNLGAEKKDGQWWSGKQLLSHNTLKLIEKKLGEIKAVKTIEGDPKSFFDNPVAISVNDEPWLLGDMTFDKSAFYVSQAGKVSLAILDGEGGGISTHEDEIEASKLNELKAFLTKKADEFKENQLFRFYPNLPLESVTIEVQDGLPYELLLKEDATLPPPIEGISVHHDLKNKFFSIITQFTLKKEVPYSEKLKVQKLGALTFKKKDQTSVIWQVWLKSDSRADVVVLDDQRKEAFLMVGGTLRGLFLQVQDYWDKKVIPPSEFKSFKRLPVKFIQGAEETEVTVVDREPLDFSAQGKRVRPGNMQDLFQFIFNLGPRDQADRVSQFTKSERQNFLNEGSLKIELMGQELLCIRKNSELILVNLTRGFKAHFLLRDEKLNCRMEDVLE